MSLKDAIIGNEKASRMLEKSYESGKVAHAYLFEGPEHVGKETLALAFCRLLLEDSRKNIRDNADMIFLEPNPDEKQITVEAIRDLEKNLSLYPFRSKYKVALISQAEKMNKAASNVLLKTLEEPAKTTVMILITSNSKNILETIKSRCQRIKFLPVKKKTLEDFLSDKVADRSEAERILEFAAYRPGRAVELLENKDEIAQSLEYINRFSALNGKSEHEKLDEAEEIAEKGADEIVKLLNLWTVYLRKTLLKEYGGQKDIQRSRNVAKIKKGIDLLSRTKEDLLTKNISVKLAIETLFLNL